VASAERCWVKDLEVGPVVDGERRLDAGTGVFVEIPVTLISRTFGVTGAASTRLFAGAFPTPPASASCGRPPGTSPTPASGPG
jgi:hypothetical protein